MDSFIQYKRRYEESGFTSEQSETLASVQLALLVSIFAKVMLWIFQSLIIE